jgi:hypothetical protein
LDSPQRFCKSSYISRCRVAALFKAKQSRRAFPDLVVRNKKFAQGEICMENEYLDNNKRSKPGRVTLKTLADHLGLTPGTISAVLNDSAGAIRIPQATKARIVAAARELNYQPNPLARALRSGQAAARSEFDSGSTRGALVIMDAGNFLLAMNAIQQAGLRVPDDVSIVEFDGAQAAMGYRA